MATIINMPRLSDTMEEGVVAKWLKQVGDKVEEGDILAEIETDKATMEFESFYEGVLLYIGIPEGGSAKVDSLLAIIGPEGTDVTDMIASQKDADTPSENPEPTTSAEVIEDTPAKVEEKTVDVPSSSTTRERIFASPLAKKIALSSLSENN